jgi:hypothetical protein
MFASKLERVWGLQRLIFLCVYRHVCEQVGACVVPTATDFSVRVQACLRASWSVCGAYSD